MLEKIKGGLIVSCQALEDEPLHSSFIMGRMALAAKQGGAVGIRANSPVDINEIKKITGLPIIGIIKRDYPDSEIYITPTIKEVDELLNSECEIIAVDATNRKRPNNESLQNLVARVHEYGKLIMADVSTFEEAKAAEKLGFDIVSTTMSGYTNYSRQLVGPDIELIKECVKDIKIPVIAEGRISTVEDLEVILKLGVHAVVMGSIITRPQLITKKYVDVINSLKGNK
ncbi:MAG: N-acetylmannosamine-6-phosphate 2-epimerase [Bacilli bacterium]